MTTIPQELALLKALFELLKAHRALFKQERVYRRAVALVLAEVMSFGRHTVTQLLLTLGLADEDWSSWHRLIRRFPGEKASELLFGEVLKQTEEHEWMVVSGDGTQTPRTSRKMEGVSWLRHVRTPPFMVGIHRAQRWFGGHWLVPPEQGYSRAIPIYWISAFTQKAKRRISEARTESEAALKFLHWVREQLVKRGRAMQKVLFVADGAYDTVRMWNERPDEVNVLVRTAKNRALYELPTPSTGRGRPRKYGPRAPTPQVFWRLRDGWRSEKLTVRGRIRRLRYRVEGPFVRKNAPQRPVFLLIVRGIKRHKGNHTYRRPPMAFLVNAVQDKQGHWRLPMSRKKLLFWAWQRWEVEVTHRELKSTFGMGHKQAFSPRGAIASVQWSVWVYAQLALAGYRTWGLCGAPPSPGRWWRGAPRWSFNTLLRSYRAALWGAHDFSPLWDPSTTNWPKKECFLRAWANATFGSVPL